MVSSKVLTRVGCGLHTLGDPLKGSKKLLLDSGLGCPRRGPDSVPWEVLREISISQGLSMSQLADPIRICLGMSKSKSGLDSGLLL